MSALFTPITIRSTTIRNRVWVAPMCQYSVDDEDGVPTDWHLVHLGSFASGGAGLVMTEATAVTPEGRISPQDTGIWNDEQAEAWKRIVDFIHARGATAGMQLAHAGRKGSTWRPWSEHRGTVTPSEGGWQSVAPSQIAFDGFAAPIALSTDEIGELVASFARAAVRATRAGFDVIEIHAAHGYLLHEFLSPLSNDRNDEYGGSLENRARALLDVVRAVRHAVGESVPVLVRFSATDYADGGWTPEATATVAGWAREAGADFFDVSSGGLVDGVHVPVAPGYQVAFAETVRTTADVPVNAVGVITEAEQAEDIIARGRADAVMLGRELLRDPHFALRAAHQLGVDLDYYPPQYLRAKYGFAPGT